MEQSGEPDHSKPFGILLRGFLFFTGKEGFYKIL